MFYENLENLKNESIPLYNYYRSNKIDKYRLFNFEKNKSHIDIFLNKKDETYLTSVEKKEYEAELLVDDILSSNRNELIIIGIGNAIILNKLLDKVDQDRKIHIIEFKEVFDIIFRNSDLTKTAFHKINNFLLVDKEFKDTKFINKIFFKTNMDFSFFVLPQYQRLFPKKIEEFYNVFSDNLKSNKSSLHVNQAYQKKWIYNSIINFKHVLSTPNLIDFKSKDFEDSLAIVVGAGPSLNYDIEKLKELNKEDKVYIFAVGSAYKNLIKNNIDIDIIFSYDPTALNQDVLQEYYDKNLQTPICFGSSIGFESIREVNYENAFHLITSQDYFSKYLLELDNRVIVSDAPSIAIIAIQGLAKIGFKKIIFTGMNLGYLSGRNYADGIEYDRLKDREYKSNLKTEDVFGNEIYTMKGYEQTRKMIEKFISVNPKIDFVNSTHGGANIQGAKYISLDEIDFNNSNKKFNFNNIENKKSYDLKKVRKQFNKLLHSRDEFNKFLQEGFKLLVEVNKAIDNKNKYDKNLIIQLEKKYNQICKNDYFNVLISKLERNYIAIFENDVTTVNREKNIEKKFELIYKKMGTIFTLFKKNDKKVYEIFVYILKWIEWE